MGSWRFQEFRLDCRRGLLERNGAAVALRPKAWQALCALVTNAGRLLSANELLDKVWPNQVVSPKVLTNVISEIRLALGDEHAPYRFIRTVPRRGYSFMQPVQAVPESSQAKATAALEPVRAANERVCVQREDVALLELGGREAELQRFMDHMDPQRSKPSTMICLTGEMGIGKTRLAKEFCRIAQGHGRLTVFATALESLSMQQPFCCLLEMLGRVFEIDPQGSRTLIMRFAPSWAVLFPQLFQASELAHLNRRAEVCGPGPLVHEGVRLVLEAARTRPLVLVLDDVQWCDKESWALLMALSRTSPDSSLAVVITFKREPQGSQTLSVEEGLWRLIAESRALLMELRRLTSEEVLPLLQKEVTPCDEASRMLDSVMALTQGLPLYLTVALTSMDKHQSDFGPGHGLALRPSQTHLQLIRSRLRTLAGPARSVLDAASCCPGPLTPSLIAAAASITEHEALEGCELLSGLSVFRPCDKGPAFAPSPPLRKSEPCFEFAHSLFAYCVRSELSGRRLIEVREGIASALRAACGIQTNAQFSQSLATAEE